LSSSLPFFSFRGNFAPRPPYLGRLNAYDTGRIPQKSRSVHKEGIDRYFVFAGRHSFVPSSFPLLSHEFLRRLVDQQLLPLRIWYFLSRPGGGARSVFSLVLLCTRPLLFLTIADLFGHPAVELLTVLMRRLRNPSFFFFFFFFFFTPLSPVA